jgi:hypothetical protein
MKTLLLLAAFWLQPPQELYRDNSVWFSYKAVKYDRTVWITTESHTPFMLTVLELPGDLNGDGKNNMEDFAIFARQYKPE